MPWSEADALAVNSPHSFQHGLVRMPGDFSAPIVIIQHLDPRHRNLIAGILSRQTRMRVKQAEEGEPLP